MLHQTTVETVAGAKAPTNKERTYKPRPTGLAPNIYWCDYHGKVVHTRERCWKLHRNPNESTKKTSGNNSKSKECSNPRANTTEAVLNQELSTKEIQALKRL